jgi:hypothetical protein
MKRRARRAVIGGAALVALVVDVLVVANWGTVRDHVEAWWFQATSETAELNPLHLSICLQCPFQDLANQNSQPVILPTTGIDMEHVDLDPGLASAPLEMLRKAGFRILEQRFPRRAYVVVRAAETIPDAPIAETFLIPSALSQSEPPLR